MPHRVATHGEAARRAVDHWRGSAASRGYGHCWRRLRRWVLAAGPLCVVCGRLATDVDHIVPRRLGGTDSLDNLQPLCHECHSRKTAGSDGALGRGRKISGALAAETEPASRANLRENQEFVFWG